MCVLLTSETNGYRQTVARQSVAKRMIPEGCGLADDGTNLEVDDGIPVDSDFFEDGVAVLVELRGASHGCGLAAELHRRGHQLERRTARRLAVLHVPVGDRLRVDGALERVLH